MAKRSLTWWVSLLLLLVEMAKQIEEFFDRDTEDKPDNG